VLQRGAAWYSVAMSCSVSSPSIDFARAFASCSVLQCVAVCCSVLQFVAVCCSVLQCVAALQCVAVYRHRLSTLRGLLIVAVCCSELPCVAVCCSVAVCGSVLSPSN